MEVCYFVIFLYDRNPIRQRDIIVKHKHGIVFVISVIGCADLVAPENAWHKRNGHIATIGCSQQNKTWHLRCDGERWQGVVGSCDQTGKFNLYHSDAYPYVC